MATLLYIHGFLSSPLSFKARATQRWLYQHRPDIEFLCPALSSYPNEAVSTLSDIMSARHGDTVYLIGSSLGGFWATWLMEEYKAARAVLINPAVAPHKFVAPLIGEELKSYYSEQTFCLQPTHIQDLKNCECEALSRPKNYWLMVQTGDQTLDYRHAIKKYSNCKQLVEDGGDHSFQNYEKWLPQIIDFFESKNS
ncbi:YqiA/YcfP family alpha/beta fold hydrolase [Teredinibacter haidensis]|uniref:YqiA/YcfP family alpha/beta fold hydrolase n=1 Tax=Teredinibacter haidensis TaxID=2731755 RepID=UPI000948F3C4|nr:YqiA/YcfP family alpha/beta fold hydrolase [Teredinibacter haidensis]